MLCEHFQVNRMQKQTAHSKQSKNKSVYVCQCQTSLSCLTKHKSPSNYKCFLQRKKLQGVKKDDYTVAKL